MWMLSLISFTDLHPRFNRALKPLGSYYLRKKGIIFIIRTLFSKSIII